jgi:predicted lipoprotein with Yx(FWY)xxD motif
MLKRSKLALVGLACVVGTVPATPAFAQYDPYTQCLIDHCFGNFQNDPAGYRRCQQACAAQYPPQFAPPSRADLNGKLD